MGVQLDLRSSLPFLDGNGCPKRPTRKPDPCLGGAVLGAVDVGEAWDSHTYSYISCVAHCGLKQTHKTNSFKEQLGSTVLQRLSGLAVSPAGPPPAQAPTGSLPHTARDTLLGN